MLNLDSNDPTAITKALAWSLFRRRHQTEARRAHLRRRLTLQLST